MENGIDITTDYHAHILPGVDHGCHSLGMCEQQLEFARSAGIKTIISTSHFYPHVENVEEFLERRDEALQEVIPLAKKMGITVVPCAETLWCHGIERMDGLERLLAKNERFNHLLLELPFNEFDPEVVLRSVKHIHKKLDTDILLAHVERYNFDDILEIDEEYVYYQINAYTFHELIMIPKVRKYMKTGKVRAFGSDIHELKNTYGHGFPKKYGR